MASPTPQISVVIPSWNGLHWLPGCLASLARQVRPADEVIIVDNGSSDGSLAYLEREHPAVRVIALGANTGFAHAANRGLDAARGAAIALINTDIELAPDWIARMAAVLEADSGVGAVACKMLSLDDPACIYDAGDVLRRDGACEQRGRFARDDGRYDEAGEVFGACAGAALYRRAALHEVGGFDERYWAYLEDVDLALRLRLAGWRCAYEPVVALHAGEGSSSELSDGHLYFVARNTLLLVAKAFPLRWLPFVLYRQLSWAWHALRQGRLPAHVRGLRAALPLLRAARREHSRLVAASPVPVDRAVPPAPFHGPSAGGHPAAIAASWQA